MPIQTKRTILTQQCLTIMMNCSEDLKDETKNEHLSFFMARMQASGYDHAFRLQILKSAKNAYAKLKEGESHGIKMHRERTWNRNQRRKEKEGRRKNWFNTDKYHSVMFIAATPKSELKKKMQDAINRKGGKIKVIEKSGTKIIRMLQRNDPFKNKRCAEHEKCLVCSGDKPGGCRDNGVTYRINCKGNCDHEYNGQTGQNGFTRGCCHLDDYRLKKEDSPLWKHCVKVHNSELQSFQMTILDRCRGDATKRQILESLRIQQVPEERSMNSKGEWNTARVPRVRIVSDVR